MAAIAQATSRIRLASAVSVLSPTDPVRLHQDYDDVFAEKLRRWSRSRRRPPPPDTDGR
ncbi:hypothetical protein ABZ313_31770 [Streptomyces sp. NPDC006251]|uniref:hypothetical protein n=1 Tax=Streptomyces sp. NPDC006251 TaxID=3155718 RepID=UPI00339E63C4